MSSPLLTLATDKERIDYFALTALGLIADDFLSMTASNGIYRSLLYVEYELDILLKIINNRANRIIELCHTGK